MRDTRRTRIVLAVLLLTAFTFITLDARGGESSILDRVRESACSRSSGPIERAAAAVVRPVSDFIDGLTSINSNQTTDRRSSRPRTTRCGRSCSPTSTTSRGSTSSTSC